MVARFFYIPILTMKLNNDKKKYIAPYMKVYDIERTRLLNASAGSEDLDNEGYWSN